MKTEQISDEERGHIIEEKRLTNKKALKVLLILLAVVAVLFAGIYTTLIILKKEDIRFEQFDNALNIVKTYEDNSSQKAQGASSTLVDELQSSTSTKENLELLYTINDYNNFMFTIYRNYFSSVQINKLDEGNIKSYLKDLTNTSNNLITSENQLWDMFGAGGFNTEQKQASFYTFYLPDAVKYQTAYLELNTYLLNLLHSKDIFFPVYIEDLIYIQQNSLKSVLKNGLTGRTATSQDSSAYILKTKLAQITSFIEQTIYDYPKLSSFVKNDDVNNAIVSVISACNSFSDDTKFTPLNTALIKIVSTNYYNLW